MSAFHDNALMGASGSQGYTISRSVRLRSSASAYFNRTPASATNRQTFTYSIWLKRGSLSSRMSILDAYASSSGHVLEFQSDDTLEFYSWGVGATSLDVRTTQVFRDPSAWYHIILSVDTTQATASNRVKMYLNGVQITALGTATYPSQNASLYIDNNIVHDIGRRGDAQFYYDGYLTEINFIDGQQLTPSSFGETDAVTGVWKPKKYGGTYGTNGFYLNFSDNSNNTATTIGKDSSGNGNNWTPNNISVTSGVTYDSMIDSPTMYIDGGTNRGNYATPSPLNQGSYVTLSNGNLTVTGNTATNSALALASIGGLTSGKWYWEYTQGTVGSETCGITTTYTPGTSLINGENIGAYGIGARPNGTVYGGTVGSITSWTNGDVIGIAVDCDNGAIYWSKNGTWLNSGVPTSGASKTGAVGTWTPSSSINVTPAFGAYNGGFVNVTFGQRPFSYTPPTGFKALNTFNLPEPTIKKGNQYFDVALQTGNTTGRTVSGLGFQPDLVWVKNRAGSANRRWGLIDSVRGVNKTLCSNLADAEVTSQTDLLTAFNSDGFTIGADAGLYGWNGYAESWAHFAWKAGNGSSSNTNGSITSTVSVNATAGFSVVTWTGTGSNATVGHGLGVAPKMIILKPRNSADNWPVWHGSFAVNEYVYLNNTNAKASLSTFMNSTLPSSTVFSLGTWANTNTNAQTMVAYCFAEVAGYSSFGKFTGNGSSDGPFVYCGFRPAFVMIKRTDTTGIWYIWDNKRIIQANGDAGVLQPQASDAEADYNASGIDLLSNGFKTRNTDGSGNGSGGTFIYAAFAESPFKLSLAR